MTAWRYKAIDDTGRTARGTVEAASAAAARAAVRAQGLLPLEVRLGGREGRLSVLTSAPGRSRVSGRSLASATRQISTLIGSGVQIEEAVRLVAGEHHGQAVGEAFEAVGAAILEGRSLSAALARQPGVFPDFYRASVAAGEASGRLSEVLAHLTDYISRQEQGRRRIQLALLYPTLLGTLSLCVLAALIVYVIPDIAKVFTTRGVTLPWLTRAMIGLSLFVQTYGVYVAILIVAVLFGFRRWSKRADNALRLARWRLDAPLFAELIRQLNAARFSASLSTLVGSDVPLLEAMKAAAAVTPNLFVRERALWAADRLKEGVSLRRALEEADVFPKLLLAVVASGEQSGRLAPALDRASSDIESDLNALVAALVALIEPVVLIAMGVLVMLIVLAILMPIIRLNDLAAL